MINVAARVVIAVNTAKLKCPTMSMGSQQSACEVTTALASTGFVQAKSGSACWVGVELVGATITGLDPAPVAMAIGIVCAVHSSSR